MENAENQPGFHRRIPSEAQKSCPREGEVAFRAGDGVELSEKSWVPPPTSPYHPSVLLGDCCLAPLQKSRDLFSEKSRSGGSTFHLLRALQLPCKPLRFIVHVQSLSARCRRKAFNIIAIYEKNKTGKTPLAGNKLQRKESLKNIYY